MRTHTHTHTHRRTDIHDEANSRFSQFASEIKSEGRIMVGKSQCINKLERPGRRWQNNLFLKMYVYIYIYTHIYVVYMGVCVGGWVDRWISR